MPSNAFYTALTRKAASRFKAATDATYQGKRIIQDGLIVNRFAVGVRGTQYEMDSSNLDVQAGDTLAVYNAGRAAAARYVPADVYGGGGRGGSGRGLAAHDIIGPYHYADGLRGQVVGLIADDTLALLTLGDLLELWGGMYLGRREGNHVGLKTEESDEGTVHTFELMDTGGRVLMSAGYIKDVPNSYWMKLGPETDYQITYVNDGTRDGIEKNGTWSLPAAIIDGYLGIEYGTTLPDAFDRDPGWLFALQSPGDPYSFVLYMRDNLDSWQRLIGAGYAAVHTHTSDETGGLITAAVAAGLDDPAYVQDETTYAILYDETDPTEPITTGLFVESDGDTPMQLDAVLQIGDVDGGNYTQIGTDGTLTLAGDATAWDDLMIPGQSVRVGGTAPDWTQSFVGDTSMWYYAFDGGTTVEEVFFSIQMPHQWKQGSTIYPHVHFAPTSTNTGDTNSRVVRFSLEYTWANINSTFGSTSLLQLDSDGFVPNTSQWNHLLAKNATGIDGTGKTLSSMLMCRLYRDGADSTDTYPQDVAFLQFDVHYEIDSFGSSLEYTK